MLRKETDFDLTGRNTFGMKVRCACFVEYDSEEDLRTLDFNSLPQPVMPVGEGSNLLFTGDFRGTLLHSGIRFVKYVDLGLDDVYMAVGAGVIFDDFCHRACEAGYWGAENLSLIPGQVGAAAVQNVGAYGAEVSDIISGVVCYDTVERKKVTFKGKDCRYAYRDSRFKGEDKGRYIVTSVLFHLTRKHSPNTAYKGIGEALGGTDPKTPQQVREAVIRIRRQKLPDPCETGSAGSFFKNPVVSENRFRVIAAQARENGGEEVPHYDAGEGKVKIPAAWLIDRCGLKGVVERGAAVYEKHSLVIVNQSGDASPDDILALEKRIINEVDARFGVKLQPEVEHI
ncbi:MAG: UDP-N-acetylmuramate dehydrogenase [Bacteroidales bacterium]|nr:UDP-N-acetylmuramate dehydrogenase [Bacteroidales bacterium]